LSLVAELYIALFNAILSDPSTGHGPNGYYIAENGDYTLYEASKAIGEALVSHGKSKAAEPNAFTSEECMKYFGVRELAFWFRYDFLTSIRPGLLPREHLSLQGKPLPCYRLEPHQDNEGFCSESGV
jgi:hypothetical protein